MRLTVLAKKFLHFSHRCKQQVIEKKVNRILSDSSPYSTKKAESQFDQLQEAYPTNRGDGYSYDDVSLFNRAAKRAGDILSLPGMNEAGKEILDIGAGDGTLGGVLNTYGHNVALTDLVDWRCRMARSIEFKRSDISNGLPFDDESFDLVTSFNAFEHFADPVKSLSEAIRVTRPNGLLYFDFGPLYSGPWGLHAYRTLYMPYAQFLFSDAFIRDKLAKLGVEDLGNKRSELQYLNKYKASRFMALWENSGCVIERCQWGICSDYIDLVFQFPESFRGRGLDYTELITSSNSVCLRKCK